MGPLAAADNTIFNTHGVRDSGVFLNGAQPPNTGGDEADGSCVGWAIWACELPCLKKADPLDVTAVLYYLDLVLDQLLLTCNLLVFTAMLNCISLPGWLSPLGCPLSLYICNPHVTLLIMQVMPVGILQYGISRLI
jgi:hypothetical protein